MGTVEQLSLIKAINRLESASILLMEVSQKDERFSERFSVINEDLKKFSTELSNLAAKLKIENLGTTRINSSPPEISPKKRK